MARKVLVLLSGGLDSTLALKLMERASLEVTGVHFRTWFNVGRYELPGDYGAVSSYQGIRILNFEVSEEFTPILLNPHYGYGSSANPCIDCKLFFLKKAKELMEKLEAHFIATGEVLGQRPMTQNLPVMQMLEKRSGLKGYLLRPLSAKLLMPTIPEELGWIDRESLYSISGRSRKAQMRLAEELGIGDYPSPAGGCHLTDQQMQGRLKALVTRREERAASQKAAPTEPTSALPEAPTGASLPEPLSEPLAGHLSAPLAGRLMGVAVSELFILRYGRHFELEGGSKLVVGRNEQENNTLKKIAWGNLTIDATSVPGPFSLMEWDGRVGSFRRACEIIAGFCSKKSAGGLLPSAAGVLSSTAGVLPSAVRVLPSAARALTFRIEYKGKQRTICHIKSSLP